MWVSLSVVIAMWCKFQLKSAPNSSVESGPCSELVSARNHVQELVDIVEICVGDVISINWHLVSAMNVVRLSVMPISKLYFLFKPCVSGAFGVVLCTHFYNRRVLKYYKAVCSFAKRSPGQPSVLWHLVAFKSKRNATWLPVIRLVYEKKKKKNPVYSSSHVLCVVRTVCFGNGVNLTAELWVERQRFCTKRVPLQQEVQHTEVVFSLCIPFYGYLIQENGAWLLHYFLFHSIM